MKSVTKTFKLSQGLAEALSRQARKLGVNESQLIRRGIEQVTGADEAGLDMRAMIGEEIGIASGPKDLSSARKHLKGYGRSRDR